MVWRFKKTVLLLTLFLLLMGAVTWPLHASSGAPRTLAYTTAAVRRGTLTLEVTPTGTLEPYTSTTIWAGAQGQISGSIPEVGQKVSRGQVLIRLENHTLATKLAHDRLMVQRVQLKLGDSQRAPAPPTLTQQIQNDEVAIAEDQATVAADTSAIQSSTVTAQTYGTVQHMSASLGDHVVAGADLLTLVNGSDMQLSGVTFGRIDGLTAGTPALVTLSDGQMIHGTVTSFPNTARPVGPADGHVVTVDMPNPGFVTPGEHATAWVKTRTADFTLAGNVQPHHLVDVTASLSGSISGLDVSTGSSVKVGQPLVSIGSTTATDQLAQDDVALGHLERALKTALEQSALSTSQNQEASALLQNALAQDEVNLQADVAAQARLKVVSPVSGVVTNVPKVIQPGTPVGKSTNVATVEDLSKLLLTVNVDQSQVNDIHPGQGVQVISSGAPGPPLAGTITGISVMGASQNGTTDFPVTITINHPGPLKPGMTAAAQFAVARARNALCVPNVAIHEINGAPIVFVLQGNDSIRQVPITIGLQTDTAAQVLGGLRAGEDVITSGYQDIGTQKRRINVRGRVLHRRRPPVRPARPRRR